MNVALILSRPLERPQQLYAHGDPPPDLADLAAALAYDLARNHPFVDGNKRTAAVCCETFIQMNGATLEADDLDLYPQYLALAEGNLSESEFARWLRPRIRGNSGHQAHEPRSLPGAAQDSCSKHPSALKARLLCFRVDHNDDA